MLQPGTKVKPSRFLRTLDPFTVYDAEELAMDYVKEVGRPPCWPIHSAKRAQLDIMARQGTGMWMNTDKPLATVAYGWEVAESVAKQWAIPPEEETPNLEERYRAAVLKLEDAGK